MVLFSSAFALAIILPIVRVFCSCSCCRNRQLPCRGQFEENR